MSKGRPKKDNPRVNYVRIRLTNAELQEVEQYRKNTTGTLSGLIRESLMNYVRKEDIDE